MEERQFDTYPVWIVLVSFGATVAIYALGAYVLSGFGVLVAALYLGYCGFVEVSVLRGSCRHCYYYGKLCALGRGKLCSLLFQRGSPDEFLRREPSFRDILPDLLVPAIPLLGGAALLFREFDWVVLAAMMSILLLGTVGTGLVRGLLACRHCAQRALGCPAEQLFNRKRA